MGNPNTDSIQHLVNDLPNTFRDQELFQILNDIDEDKSGKGYMEVLRSPGPFVSSLITWDSSSKNKKRTETILTRTGSFVTSIEKKVYSQDGTVVIATITATITRTASNQVNVANVQIVRV